MEYDDAQDDAATWEAVAEAVREPPFANAFVQKDDGRLFIHALDMNVGRFDPYRL